MVEMAIGMYPIPPPDDKTIAAIFGMQPGVTTDNAIGNSVSTPTTQSPSHSKFDDLVARLYCFIIFWSTD